VDRFFRRPLDRFVGLYFGMEILSPGKNKLIGLSSCFSVPFRRAVTCSLSSCRAAPIRSMIVYGSDVSMMIEWNLVTFSNYLDRRQLECMPHAKFVERVWVAKGKVRYAQL